MEDPEKVTSHTLTDKRLRWKQLYRLWKVCLDDYLRKLPPSVAKFQRRDQLNEDSVVLIHEQNLPRLRWPVGAVVKLHPDLDGLVRAADVKTKRGVHARAVQRLHNQKVAGEPDANDDDCLFIGVLGHDDCKGHFAPISQDIGFFITLLIHVHASLQYVDCRDRNVQRCLRAKREYFSVIYVGYIRRKTKLWPSYLTFPYSLGHFYYLALQGHHWRLLSAKTNQYNAA